MSHGLQSEPHRSFQAVLPNPPRNLTIAAVQVADTSALLCMALYCIALHYLTLHCTALHYSDLHCTALHYSAMHITVLHYTVQITALYCIALL